MKAIGFIFARGGSKGVPRKNIRKLGGIPLIGHSIKAGQESGLLERIIVSTDDPEIAEVAKDLGAEVPFMRPAEIAMDNSAEWLSWQHAVEQVDDFDIFVSLPATSPMRSAEDVRNCIAAYTQGGCDIVITTQSAHRHPSFNMVTVDDNGLASLVMPSKTPIIRRQDAPTVYDVTTVAYITSPEFIMNNRGVYDGRVRAVQIPDERALDIDTELDFAFAEFMYQRSM